MKTWLIRIGIGAAIIIILVGWWKMAECRKKAKKSGQPFRCRLFKSEPNYRMPNKEYYRVDEDGKCQKIIDYGNRMTFKDVPLQYCK